jgi:hypothetical protein
MLAVIDYITTDAGATYEYEELVYMLDITVDGTEDLTLSVNDIVVKEGEHRQIYIGGLKQFTVTCSDDHRIIVNGNRGGLC